MKNTGNLTVVLVILALFVGIAGGYAFHPDVRVIDNEVQIEVPTIVYQNQSVAVEVEVERDYLSEAYDAFLVEYEDEDSTPAGYDFDQLVKFKFEDKYKVVFDDDKQTVKFDVELKFLDKDTENKDYVDYSVEVVFEENEDPEVSY